MRLLLIGLSLLCLLFSAELLAQAPVTRRIPSSEISFLSEAPDARSAAMGNAGVALSPDANSSYWNASKLAFAEKDFGASISYTPWLHSLSSDMWMGYATAYKKLRNGQAIAVSINNFNKLSQSAVIPPTSLIEFKSNQYVFNGTYSRQLGKNFSMGLTAKYITSDLKNPPVINGVSLRPARTIAGDLSAFYRKQFRNEMTGRDLTWSLGAVLSNFGGKVSYGPGTNTENFIPTTLKVGGGLSYTKNGRHRFNLVLDAGKLMVPTPVNGKNVSNKPLISGVFQSFSDAPDGFQEEIQEVAISIGGEYWYKNIIALRGGYYGENKNKGDRKYYTAGSGLRFLKNYEADFSYLFPVDSNSALEGTFRISLSAYLNGKQNRSL